MLPTTPRKKAHTDDLRSKHDASNAHCDSIIPEDLSIALQSLGSRVRKSVTEGYSTLHLATSTVPATPCSSPAKLSSSQATPVPIFRSSKDALNSVFPPGSLHVPLTPSPKKRRRPEELGDCESRRIQNSHMEMGAESIDDDQVMVNLGPDANSNAFSSPRKIKPLRRSAIQNRTSAEMSDPFSVTSQDVRSHSPSLDVMQSGWVEMDFSEETTG